MKICTCNQCGNIYADPNPASESIEYPDNIFIDILPMIKCNDGDFTYACPVCETDGNLMDNITAAYIGPKILPR